MKKRFCYNILVLFSIIGCPFWVSASFLVLGLFVFPRYWEAILFATLVDLIFAPGGAQWIFPLGIAAVALFGFAVSEMIRTKLRPGGGRGVRFRA